MKQKFQATNDAMQQRIDALVCGELESEQRRELLAWLDADAARWRACGLAFLEAQIWCEALEEEGSGVRGQESGVRSQGSAIQCRTSRPEGQVAAAEVQGGRRPWLAPLLVLAASLAAFICGLAVQEVRHHRSESTRIAGADAPNSSPDSAAPLVATVPVKGGALGPLSATLQIPVRPAGTSSDVASSVPESLRRHWERRGYELVEERRYLPAKLPDGRQVMVPVNEVKMKFVGKPVS